MNQSLQSHLLHIMAAELPEGQSFLLAFGDSNNRHIVTYNLDPEQLKPLGEYISRRSVREQRPVKVMFS